MTANYVIIPDLPLEVRPDLAMKEERFILKFNKEVPARYGIFKKNEKNSKNIKWFELPSHYCSHFVNAWEETNEEGH